MKRTILITLLAALALLGVCGLAAAQTTNPITGLETIEDESVLSLPPIFVPMARYPSKYRPTSGHSEAPWVFEMYVDGEESRPVLMFYGDQPDVDLSHISSAFFGLESLRVQYGGVIIAGGTSQSVLDSDIKNLEQWYGTTYDQLYPTLPLANYKSIVEKWAKKATPADPNNLTYSFDSAIPEGGQNADSLYVRYAATNQILWRYDGASGKYIRAQNSVEDPATLSADVDSATGEQIGAENLIILMAHHDYVPDTDPTLGFFDIDLNYAEGTALIFRDGKMYSAKWSTVSGNFERESDRNRPIRFLDDEGNAFKFKPGQTWVHIVMSGNPVYEVDAELGTTPTPGSAFWKLPYISFKPGSKAAVEAEVPELQDMTYELNTTD